MRLNIIFCGDIDCLQNISHVKHDKIYILAQDLLYITFTIPIIFATYQHQSVCSLNNQEPTRFICKQQHICQSKDEERYNFYKDGVVIIRTGNIESLSNRELLLRMIAEIGVIVFTKTINGWENLSLF